MPTLNLTVWTNSVCAVAAIGSEVIADPSILGIFPPKVAHVVTMIALAAMWYRSHQNIFVNPPDPKGK